MKGGSDDIFSVAGNGDLEKMKKLLSSQQKTGVGTARGGVNITNIVNLRNETGETPLMVAARNGHFEMVKLLSEYGALLNALDNNGDSALFFAAKNSHLDAAIFLIKGGADLSVLTQQNKNNILLSSAEKKNEFRAIELLAKGGADLSVLSEVQRAVIMGFSIKIGKEDMFKLFLSSIERDDAKDYALTVAAESGQLAMVRFLVEEKGADVDWKGKGKDASLAIAAHKGHDDIVLFLVEKGADLSGLSEKQKADALGDVLISVVKKAKSDDVKEVESLVRRGADVFRMDEDGYTALMHAAIGGHEKIAEFLVSNWAEMDIDETAEYEKVSVLDVAIKCKNYGVAQMLLEKGADAGHLLDEKKNLIKNWKGGAQQVSQGREEEKEGKEEGEEKRTEKVEKVEERGETGETAKGKENHRREGNRGRGKGSRWESSARSLSPDGRKGTDSRSRSNTVSPLKPKKGDKSKSPVR
jgi:ankyrin repeat protein